MKVHTTAFKEQIKEMGRELDSIITYGDTVLGNEQLNAVTPSFQSSILKSVMKQLDVDSNVEIPIGTILKYEFGLKVNGEYEYLDFGNYVVYKVEKQEDLTKYNVYNTIVTSNLGAKIAKANIQISSGTPKSARFFVTAMSSSRPIRSFLILKTLIRIWQEE